jgi:hypothetical protein
VSWHRHEPPYFPLVSNVSFFWKCSWKPPLGVYVCTPSTQETEAVGSQVWNQPGLHNKTGPLLKSVLSCSHLSRKREGSKSFMNDSFHSYSSKCSCLAKRHKAKKIHPYIKRHCYIWLVWMWIFFLLENFFYFYPDVPSVCSFLPFYIILLLPFWCNFFFFLFVSQWASFFLFLLPHLWFV